MFTGKLKLYFDRKLLLEDLVPLVERLVESGNMLCPVPPDAIVHLRTYVANRITRTTVPVSGLITALRTADPRTTELGLFVHDRPDSCDVRVGGFGDDARPGGGTSVTLAVPYLDDQAAVGPAGERAVMLDALVLPMVELAAAREPVWAATVELAPEVLVDSCDAFPGSRPPGAVYPRLPGIAWVTWIPSELVDLVDADRISDSLPAGASLTPMPHDLWKLCMPERWSRISPEDREPLVRVLDPIVRGAQPRDGVLPDGVRLDDAGRPFRGPSPTTSTTRDDGR